MKKIPFIFVALLTLGLFLSATTGRMIIKVKETGHEKTIALHLANLNKEFTTVNVVDLNGKVWHAEQIWNQRGFAANIDLSALTPGDYMLYIKNASKKAVVALFITEKNVVFVNNNYPGFTYRSEAFYNPTPFSRLLAHFYTYSDKPTLNMKLANLREGPTTIRISSVEGWPIYNEQFTGENGYHKSINLGEAANGTYYLYLNTVEAKVFQMIDMNEGNLRFGPTMGKEKALLEGREAVAAK